MTAQLFAAVSTEEMSRAVEIAVTGMLIVFVALAILTVFLTLLPRLLTVVNTVWPEAVDHQAAQDTVGTLDEEDEVLAAIAFVAHAEARELT